MNPNQQPMPGGQVPRPLTKEALEKEYVIKMKREHILIIYNMFSMQNNYSLGDAKRILEVLDYFKDAVVLTDKDFVPMPKAPAVPGAPTPPPAPGANGIKV